jgi:hypothetical protein
MVAAATFRSAPVMTTKRAVTVPAACMSHRACRLRSPAPRHRIRCACRAFDAPLSVRLPARSGLLCRLQSRYTTLTTSAFRRLQFNQFKQIIQTYLSMKTLFLTLAAIAALTNLRAADSSKTCCTKAACCESSACCPDGDCCDDCITCCLLGGGCDAGCCECCAD